LNFNVGAGTENLIFRDNGKRRRDHSGNSYNMQDRESKHNIFNTENHFQDSNSCKFTIKIDNFTPELGETGKPIIYRFNCSAGNNYEKLKW
jgi:hypothetical protein